MICLNISPSLSVRESVKRHAHPNDCVQSSSWWALAPLSACKHAVITIFHLDVFIKETVTSLFLLGVQ